MSASVLFLMYHAVLPRGASGEHLDPQERRFAVRESDFLAALDLLHGAQNFRRADVPAAPDDAGGYEQGHRYCLTFDDAWAEHAEVTAPILKKRKLHAAFFIASDQIARDRMLLWRDVRGLAEAGFVIGSHGKTHRFLTEIEGRALTEELAGSRKALEDGLGRKVTHLSLPGGRYDERVLDAARRAGYAMVFTSDPGLWQEGALVPRVAVRLGADGTETIRRLVADPFGETGRLRRRAAALGTLRRVLGNERYHRWHAWWVRRQERP